MCALLKTVPREDTNSFCLFAPVIFIHKFLKYMEATLGTYKSAPLFPCLSVAGHHSAPTTHGGQRWPPRSLHLISDLERDIMKVEVWTQGYSTYLIQPV